MSKILLNHIFSSWSLRRRIFLLNTFVIAIVIVIAVFNYFSFKNISTDFRGVIENDIFKTFRDDRLSQKINSLFLHASIYVRTFLSEDASYEVRRKILEQHLLDVQHALAARDESVLIATSALLDATIRPIVHQSETLFEASKKISELQKHLTEELLKFDQKIADEIIERKGKEQSFELFGLDQVSASIPDTVNSVTQIAIALLYAQSDYLGAGIVSKNYSEQVRAYFATALTNVGVISSAGRAFLNQRESLEKILLDYQAIALQWLQQLETFQAAIKELPKAEDGVSRYLGSLQEKFDVMSSRVRERVVADAFLLQFRSALLSLIIFVVIGFYVLFYVRNVLKPISRLSDEVSHLADSLELGLPVKHLDDEIEHFSSLFHSMVDEIHSKTQNLVAAKARAEEANRVKSVFLDNMSHEIRTPMNSILGLVDVLQEIPESSEEQKKYLNIIQKSSESLLDLINNALDLSKIEAGKIHLVQKEFDVLRSFKSVLGILSPRMMAKSLKLNFDTKLPSDFTLIGDSLRLRQILINLISNAVKFTEQGEITVQLMGYELDKNRYLLCFSVADTGVGIPLERQGELFERFQQLDSSVTKKYGGSGLGLSIVKELVELQQGVIRVESEVGQGARFLVEIPYLFAPPTKSEDLGEEKKFLKGLSKKLSILVVDDSEENRAVVNLFLKKEGHSIDFAENGEQAILKAKEVQYDLILMDIQMPVMDGYSATRAIRLWEGEQGIRPSVIIALTAYALFEDKLKAIDAGCSAHLSKPIKKSLLLETIYPFFAED